MNAPTLILTVEPSRWLRRVIVVMHLLACAAVLVADLAWPYRLAIMVAVAISLMATIRLPAAVTLRCQPDGHLSLRGADEWEAVELLPDTVALSWFVLLRYRRPGQTRPDSRAILPDALEPEAFRRLRVWLKWRGLPGM